MSHHSSDETAHDSYCRAVLDFFIYRQLPPLRDRSEFHEAEIQAALAQVPRPISLDAVDASVTIEHYIRKHQLVRRTVQPSFSGGPQPTGTLRQINKDTPTFVVVARVSDTHPRSLELEGLLREVAKRKIKHLWRKFEATGDVNTGLERMRYHFRVGTANAGFYLYVSTYGPHSLWEDVIRKDIPEADVLLVLEETGYAADLATWLYTLSFAHDDIKIVFQYDNGTIWVVSKQEFLAHIADPSAHWRRNASHEHIFYHLAAAEARAKLEWSGEAMRARVEEEESQEIEALVGGSGSDSDSGSP